MKSRTDSKNGIVVWTIYYEEYDDNGNCVKESAYDWIDGVQDDFPAWYVERTYGAEKVPVPAWEFKERHHHCLSTGSIPYSAARWG